MHTAYMCSVQERGNLFEAIEHVAERRFELCKACQSVSRNKDIARSHVILSGF